MKVLAFSMVCFLAATLSGGLICGVGPLMTKLVRFDCLGCFDSRLSEAGSLCAQIKDGYFMTTCTPKEYSLSLRGPPRATESALPECAASLGSMAPIYRFLSSPHPNNPKPFSSVTGNGSY